MTEVGPSGWDGPAGLASASAARGNLALSGGHSQWRGVFGRLRGENDQLRSRLFAVRLFGPNVGWKITQWKGFPRG